MNKMFCFDCGIKFEGDATDLYETGDRVMIVPFCKKCAIKNKLSWKPCMMCGGKITQVRKAFFKCLDCNAEMVACEEDMRA